MNLMKHGSLLIIALGAFLLSPALAQASDVGVLSTLMGAGFGGLVGSQFGKGPGNVAATATGVMVGGLIGSEVGNNIDRPHYTTAYPAYTTVYTPAYYAAPVYVPNYVAPPAPTPVVVTPVYTQPVYAQPVYTQPAYAVPEPQPTTYVDQESGRYCREYSERVQIGGQLRESYGTACMQPDGTWRIIE